MYGKKNTDNNKKENYMRECDGDFSRVLGQKYAKLCVYNRVPYS